MRGSPRRIAAEWWLVAVLSSLFVLLVAHERMTARLDTLAYDLLLRWDGHEPDPRILLVTIDDRSLQEVGPWPWPRDVQARLLRRIAAGSPAAVAYDVLLVEQGADRAADAALGDAVADGPPTFLPLLFDVPGSNGRPFDAVLPVPAIGRGAAGIGHVSLHPDADGLIRRVRLVAGQSGETWPHLMSLMRAAAGAGSSGAAATAADARPLLIPYAGPPGHFPTIGAAAVLRGELPAELLRGRLVIVGASAHGLGDIHPTVTPQGEGVMAGVEIQANILDALLAHRLVSQAGFALTAAVALVPLWLLLIGLRVLSPRATIRLAAALVLLILTSAAAAFLQLRTFVSPVPALVGLAVVYPFWGWRKLAAASGYMLGQLEQLRGETDTFARSQPTGLAADPVARQIALLDRAVTGLRDMRQFIGESLHQMPDALFVLDGDGAVLLANRDAGRLLDALELDRETSDIDAVFARMRTTPETAPDTAPSVVPSWKDAPDGALGSFWTPQGRCFEVQLGTRRDAAGAQVGRLVRLSDVTEVHLARRQREEMMNFLTHDMRSPQASILAAIATAGPGEIEGDLAGRLEGYARRTLALADNFVHLARAEMPYYRMELLDLSELLIDALDDLWPQSQAKQLTLRIAGEQREWLVHADRSLLTRALINVLDNAIKFSPAGAEIVCTLEPGTVHGKDAVACAITDAGPGIPEDHLCLLFERFGRATPATAVPGVGLGLALVRTVLTRHRGEVYCESEVGKGSTLTLLLPLAAPPAGETGPLI